MLHHDTGITYENFETASDDSYTVMEFLTECVSLSKPCAFIDLANCWRLNGALLPENTNGMGKVLPFVDVYESSDKYPFKEAKRSNMSYEDFQSKFAASKGHASLKNVYDEDTEEFNSMMK